MPRLVPSQAVTVIDDLLVRRKAVSGGELDFVPQDIGYLRGILEIIDQIPDYLRPTGAEFTLFQMATSRIREQCTGWVAGSASGALLGLDLYEGKHPLLAIRDVLSNCPDEAPSHEPSELNFIEDATLRRNLQNDFSSIHVALANGEWKGATVLAGALCEALLLWKLQQHSAAEVANAAAKRKKKPDLETWNLSDYIDVSSDLKIIEPETVSLVDLARGFRNLIHPGKVARTGQKCDRGTAFATIAAVDFIIRDITP